MQFLAYFFTLLNGHAIQSKKNKVMTKALNKSQHELIDARALFEKERQTTIEAMASLKTTNSLLTVVKETLAR